MATVSRQPVWNRPRLVVIAKTLLIHQTAVRFPAQVICKHYFAAAPRRVHFFVIDGSHGARRGELE